MAVTFFDKETTNILSLQDYISAFENGEGISTLKCLSTSLITLISYSKTPYFKDYSELEYVYLPNCTYIGNSTFENCISLKEALLNNNIFIGWNAFNNCYNLEYVNFGKNSYIDTCAFQSCSKLDNVIISENVYIGDYAFSGCISLKNINIPNCYGIGAGAFYGCEELEEAIFPNVNTFGYGIFENCYTLSNAIFNNLSYLSIDGRYSYITGYFKNCSNLRSISFPNLVSVYNFFKFSSVSQYFRNSSFYLYCDRDIFEGCSNLSMIEFPETLTNFVYTTSLSYDIYINISSNISDLLVCAKKVHFPKLTSIDSQTFRITSSTITKLSSFNVVYPYYVSSFSSYVKECYIHELYLENCEYLNSNAFNISLSVYNTSFWLFVFDFLDILSAPKVKYIGSSIFSSYRYNSTRTISKIVFPMCESIEYGALNNIRGSDGFTIYSDYSFGSTYSNLSNLINDFQFNNISQLSSSYHIINDSYFFILSSYINCKDWPWLVDNSYPASIIAFNNIENDFNFCQIMNCAENMYLNNLKSISANNVYNSEYFARRKNWGISQSGYYPYLKAHNLYLENIEEINYTIYNGIFSSGVLPSIYYTDQIDQYLVRSIFIVDYPLRFFNNIYAPKCSKFIIDIIYGYSSSHNYYIGNNYGYICNDDNQVIVEKDASASGAWRSSYSYFSHGLYLQNCEEFSACIYGKTPVSEYNPDNYFTLSISNAASGYIQLSRLNISELIVPKFSSSIILRNLYNLSKIAIGPVLDLTLYSCPNLISMDLNNVITISRLSIDEYGSDGLYINLPNCTEIINYGVSIAHLASYSNINFNAPLCSEINLLSEIYASAAAFQNILTGFNNIYLPNLNNIQMENISSVRFLIRGNDVTIGLSSSYSTTIIASHIKLPNIISIDSKMFGQNDAYTTKIILQTFEANNCLYIDSYTFANKLSLMRVDIQNCSYIGDYAFKYCQLLSNISIPNCEYIGSYAFQSCYKLSVVILPKCSYIGERAFYDTNLQLLELGYGSVIPPTFIDTYMSNFVVKVPASLYSAYQASSDWMALSSTRSIYIVSD